MKVFCSTLLLVLPNEYHKTESTLLDKQSKFIKHLLKKKRDPLIFSATVKPFPNNSCMYNNLQASQAREWKQREWQTKMWKW